MDLKRLQQFGTLNDYKRGDVLFKEGDLDPNMYIILKGVVSLRSKIGKRVKTQVLDAGDFFGETSVILGIPKMDVCVIEKHGTTLLSIPRSQFESFIREDQGFALRIMRLLSEQLLEALGERENMIHRMSKYEPVQLPDQIEDMYAPIVPEKREIILTEEEYGDTSEKMEEGPTEQSGENSQSDEEKNQSSQEESEASEGMESSSKESQPPQIAALPEELEAIKILKRIGIVLKGHGVYHSKQWPATAASCISPKAVTCPICGKTFVATYLSRSRLGAAKTDPDMRKHYKTIEPIYFDIYVCNHCGYANFPDGFGKLKKDVKEFIRSTLLMIKELPYDLGENIFDINYVFLKLYLALFSNYEKTDNILALPKIWMRLFWLYTDVGEEELAHTSVENAYAGYANVFYNTKILSAEAEVETLLLMGELALKLEMNKKSLSHFMAVLQSVNINNLQRRRAEDRIYDIRQKEKEEREREQKMQKAEE